MTMLSNSNDPIILSVPIDEYSDSIDQSITGLKSQGIKHFSIFNINGKFVSTLPDDTLLRIRKLLEGVNVQVVKLDLGYNCIPSTPAIEKQMSIASFFKAKSVILGLTAVAFNNKLEEIDKFLSTLTDRAVSMSIIPLIDLGHDLFETDPEAFASRFSKYRKIKYLYDPSRFMERSRTFPSIKWWPKISANVNCVVLRDFRTGLGYFPIGEGVTNIAETAKEFVKAGGRSLIFRPSLGRRYGSHLGKDKTFGLAYKILRERLKEVIND